MKLREYNNRFPDRNILGAIMYFPEHMSEPKALRYFSGKDTAWFVDPKTYPNGKIIIAQISIDELINTEVIGWVAFKNPLMDGDFVYVNGKKERVERVKEGDGSPYPIVTNKSQYNWSEVTLIIKEVLDAETSNSANNG